VPGRMGWATAPFGWFSSCWALVSQALSAAALPAQPVDPPVYWPMEAPDGSE
jgi:hypothetical protein